MVLEGVIFDLDGVVTDTASAHAQSWKTLFDDYLRRRQERYGESFKPFEGGRDYLAYVDGKPRYEGVRGFLNSRSIELPYGDPRDKSDQETICGLGNRKNLLFKEIVEREGVVIYDSSLRWIRQLKSRGIKVAMATSSKNGPLVLKKAGITEIFDATVDGNDSAELNLKGKPHPDIFIEAARRIHLMPEKCAVLEDALSGVQAGRAGGFALVIGVARTNSKEALLKNGADMAVADLGELLKVDLQKLVSSRKESL